MEQEVTGETEREEVEKQDMDGREGNGRKRREGDENKGERR